MTEQRLTEALRWLNGQVEDHLRRCDLHRETILWVLCLEPDDGPAHLRAELDELECRGLVSPRVSETLIELVRR